MKALNDIKILTGDVKRQLGESQHLLHCAINSGEMSQEILKFVILAKEVLDKTVDGKAQSYEHMVESEGESKELIDMLRGKLVKGDGDGI